MPPPLYTPFVYTIKVYNAIRNYRNRSQNTPSPNSVETNENRLQMWKDNVLRSLMRESAMKYYQHHHPAHLMGLQRRAMGPDVRDIHDVVTDVAKPLQDRINQLAGHIRRTGKKNEFHMKKRRSSVYQQVYGKFKQKLRKSSESTVNVSV